MASGNNWLGFSISSQENPQTHQNSSPPATIDIPGATDFYGLPTQPAPDAQLGVPGHHAPYGIMEAFNRGAHETQEWNLDYNGGASELSMLVGSSAVGGKRAVEDETEPKLEDFLGGNSFVSEQDQAGGFLFSRVPVDNRTISNGGSNTMEHSMINSWLRNNPQVPHPQTMAPPAQQPQLHEEIMSTDASARSSDGLVGNSVMAATGSLALSMSTGSGSGSHLPMAVAGGGVSGGASESTSSENKRASGAMDSSGSAVEAVARKSIDTFGQRTSIYRGVTRHRWTGRYEAHLWDNSCRREGQSRKGRQGGYDKEDKAARAYDLAALKYWGTTTTTNFPINTYEKEVDEMKHMTRQEYIAHLRRNSSGFSRGASKYRGVTRHHQHGRWQARIGRVAGNKDLYLAMFKIAGTEEEAAEAYDIAAIKFRGLNAVTNFDMNRYDVKSILESSTLPVGGAARRLKDSVEHPAGATIWRAGMDGGVIPQLTDAGMSAYASYHHHQGWPTIAFQQPSPLSVPYPYVAQPPPGWCKPEQDIQQLHLGTAARNFFQASSSYAVYNGGGGGYQQGLGGNAYLMPASTVVAEQGHSSTATNQGSTCSFEEEGNKLVGYDAMMMASTGGADPYAAASTVSVAKANGYANNWSSPFNGME
ncbi:hypothetical protein ACQ4PT_006553 [Festuca glaucescens]